MLDILWRCKVDMAGKKYLHVQHIRSKVGSHWEGCLCAVGFSLKTAENEVEKNAET